MKYTNRDRAIAQLIMMDVEKRNAISEIEANIERSLRLSAERKRGKPRSEMTEDEFFCGEV